MRLLIAHCSWGSDRGRPELEIEIDQNLLRHPEPRLDPVVAFADFEVFASECDPLPGEDDRGIEVGLAGDAEEGELADIAATLRRIESTLNQIQSDRPAD